MGDREANISRFGVFLPSFISTGDSTGRARGIIEFARVVEDLGFDSLFITDHLLTARRFYAVSFLEPLTTLSLAAGVTERVRLGTSVLVMPVREPVLLAKQIATLQFLSQNRFVLGAGVGWYEPEFQATGVQKRHRGARTDEMLQIILPLLEGKGVTYDGRFFSIEDVEIGPQTGQAPPVWVGGGSQLAHPNSPEPPSFAASVKERILAADGWIPRPTAPPEDIARDWQELRTDLLAGGRDLDEFEVVHENFFHFVATQDPARARWEQRQAMLGVMSDERGDDYLEKVYLYGTPDEVIQSLQARIDAGVQKFILHTLTPDPRQLEDWAEHIIPHVRFPVS